MVVWARTERQRRVYGIAAARSNVLPAERGSGRAGCRKKSIVQCSMAYVKIFLSA
jgi:hypothetical protein